MKIRDKKEQKKDAATIANAAFQKPSTFGYNNQLRCVYFVKQKSNIIKININF